MGPACRRSQRQALLRTRHRAPGRAAQTANRCADATRRSAIGCRDRCDGPQGSPDSSARAMRGHRFGRTGQRCHHPDAGAQPAPRADRSLTSMRPASDISRRINAERLLVLAWIRAILLQLAHPLIAAGIADHSTFRGSPFAAFARFRHTVNAMTFGRDSERTAAVHAIRAIHRRVHGTLAKSCGPFAAGTPYSAEDSALLAWVHATLIESMVLVYEELVGSLSAAERDAYCGDAADLAVALGASDRDIPRTWNELRAYIDDRFMSGEIVVGQQASTVSAALLSPFRQPLARLLATPVLSLLAAGLLPGYVRVQYGFVWNRARARQFTRSMIWLRRLRRIMPDFIALWKRARSVDCIRIRHDYSPASR